ncbi:MAG: tetratricopeptide repeat protein, partial [Bacteroidales bacterium]|nr:tetratricopeptide repeat protein [Bacteroidales bacterium]
MATPSSIKQHTWWPALVLAGLAIVLYANTLPLDYALDDTLILTGNEFTKQGIRGIPEIMTNDAFTGFFGKQKSLVAGGRYRPLSQVMFAIEYELFGFNPM